MDNSEYLDKIKTIYSSGILPSVVPFTGEHYDVNVTATPSKIRPTDITEREFHIGNKLESWISSTRLFCSLYIEDSDLWASFAVDCNLLRDSARVWVEKKLFQGKQLPQPIDWYIFCNIMRVRHIPGFIAEIQHAANPFYSNAPAGIAFGAIRKLILIYTKSGSAYLSGIDWYLEKYLEKYFEKNPNPFPKQLSEIWAGKTTCPESELYQTQNLITQTLYIHPLSHNAIVYYRTLQMK